MRQPHDQRQLVRHEKIHFWQQVEMLFLLHWVLYALFYLVGRMQGQCHYVAYRYNPFEMEAYENDPDKEYLNKRKPFAWTRYVRESLRQYRADHTGKVPPDRVITWRRIKRA